MIDEEYKWCTANEIQVLQAMDSGTISRIEHIRRDMPELRRAFKRLIEKGLIESVYRISPEGRKIVNRTYIT